MSAEAMQWLQDQLGQQRPKEPQGVIERLERRVADLEREVQALRRPHLALNPRTDPRAPGLPGWCASGAALNPRPLPRDAAMVALREHVL